MKRRASIHQAGRELLENITVDLNEGKDHAGRERWEGSFELAAQQPFDYGTYEIRLDDGRSGTMVVDRVNVSSHSPTWVSFQGSGPLRK